MLDAEKAVIPDVFPHPWIVKLCRLAEQRNIQTINIRYVTTTLMRQGERGKSGYFCAQVKTLDECFEHTSPDTLLRAEVRVDVQYGGFKSFFEEIEDWGIDSEFMRLIDRACKKKYQELTGKG